MLTAKRISDLFRQLEALLPLLKVSQTQTNTSTKTPSSQIQYTSPIEQEDFFHPTFHDTEEHSHINFGKMGDAAALFMMDTRGNDTRTVYSAATTVVPHFTQQSISGVCRDIFSKIKQHMPVNNWAYMYKTIPSLAKAFAIKLSTGPTDDLSRRITHSVYKNHQLVYSDHWNLMAFPLTQLTISPREIALHLQLMFRHANDDNSEVRIHASDVMSHHDKISMWGRNPDDDTPK